MTESKDSMGDRMKGYEMGEAGRKLAYPVCVRLDGRNFSKLTRPFARPYDPRMSETMQELAVVLARESGATMAYTQSDEITLMLCDSGVQADGYFGLRAQKLTSVLAGYASAWFTRELARGRMHERSMHLAMFDARAWSLPSLMEAANTVLWREMDATRNAISAVSQAYFSHRELHGKNTSEQLVMQRERGVSFEDYADHFRHGTYVLRRKTMAAFSAEEIEKLPPNHEARSNPNLMVERNLLETKAFSKSLRKATNRMAVMFEGEEPEWMPEETA